MTPRGLDKPDTGKSLSDPGVPFGMRSMPGAPSDYNETPYRVNRGGIRHADGR